ncbi:MULTISPECIES: hypothetical protein [Burkholderia]|uniref:Right handed beta helix domain-containing protein n=1 Tax=Burkholderia contaminans TaxID=488447 RepID=A0A6P2XY30_9BURK|nr:MULTISPECIES: hypothetical protein [Burkholderia]MDN7491912.1 hypothetical protein [Burkholderia sp. AU45274]VWD14187.1 hypothetical protein BCO71171_02713 [Burkholderia contaminans]
MKTHVIALLICTACSTGKIQARDIRSASATQLAPAQITPPTRIQNLSLPAPSSTACSPARKVGFVGDGTFDNAPVWQRWISSLSGRSACIQFEAGTFRFDATVDVNLASRQTIRVTGMAQDGTELWFPNSDGIRVVINTMLEPGFIESSSITADKFALTTSNRNRSIGLQIIGNTSNGYIPRQTNIDQISFHGHDLNSAWKTDLYLENISNVTIERSGFYGIPNNNTEGSGIEYRGVSEKNTPTILNVTNSIVFFRQTGIKTSGYWQGLNVSQTNIVDTEIGVDCSAKSPQPQCNISNSQINSARGAIRYSNIITSIISGNLFYQGAYHGMVDRDPIISLSAGSTNNIITNNIFSAFSRDHATPYCIKMADSSTTNQVINSNVFAGCSTAVAFSDISPASSQLVGNTFQSTVKSATSGNIEGLTRFDSFHQTLNSR